MRVRLKFFQGILILFLLVTGAAAGGWWWLNRPVEEVEILPSQRPVYQRKVLSIERANGSNIAFNLEIAETPEQHTFGMMYETYLPRGQGMLFLFDPPKTVSFWMKNTLIPLDMLFIGPEGRIVKIHPNAVPLDMTSISSEVPVAAVLEIRGGDAKNLGLAVGDRLSL